MMFAIRGGLVAASTALAALIGFSAPQSLAQNAPQAAPAPATPAAPPAWQQGRSAEQAESPLHPHVPPLIAAPAKDIPIQNIKLPPGFKIEVWASVAEARTMALGAKGTVFVGNRIR